MNIETHPIEPWLPANARLLMLGTFPPQRKRWSMDFYYPNYINDMWRIFGLILHSDKDYFVDTEGRTFRLDLIKEMLFKLGIALNDTGRDVEREKGNAADKHLNIVNPINLPAALAEIPQCVALATTGEKAASVIARLTDSEIPAMGSRVAAQVKMPDGSMRVVYHYRMPSSSRAYPMKLEKKAEYYGNMLRELHLI